SSVFVAPAEGLSEENYRRKAAKRLVSSVFFAPAEELSEENYRRKAAKRPVSSVFSRRRTG
ncbi:MAG: hypothetical protein JW780_07500, partial [Clostridiales bacterium]|nr:hypothetical protein [Clostridiales bacterium]